MIAFDVQRMELCYTEIKRASVHLADFYNEAKEISWQLSEITAFSIQTKTLGNMLRHLVDVLMSIEEMARALDTIYEIYSGAEERVIDIGEGISQTHLQPDSGLIDISSVVELIEKINNAMGSELP